MLPLQQGPKGNIPEHHYHNLCIAYKSYVTINQLNGELCVCHLKQVGPLVHKVIYGTNNGDDWVTLFKHVQNNSAINLRRQKDKSAEDRRVRWTTHKNLLMWFDNWENDLIQFQFAICDNTGKVHIPPELLHRIGNFDETCLSLDGSNTVHNGCPDCMIYNPRFPVIGSATSKSSLTSTLITGSNAAGEAFPPHIQFQSKAKSDDTARIDVNVAE